MNLQQRTAFSARVRYDIHLPKITNAQLLPCGIVLVDCFNQCIKLFSTQGQCVSSHPCNAIPGHLAATESDDLNSTHTLVLTLPGCTRLDFLKVTPQCVTLKACMPTTRCYRTVTAINSRTLAVGHAGENGVDLLNMDGQRLRELTLSFSPLHMIPTADGGLVCSVGGNVMVKLATDSGQVIYSLKVPQIQFLCGIAKHKEGPMLVTDANAHSLHLITPEGAWVKHLWTVPDARRRHDQLCSISYLGDEGTCVCATDEGSVFVLDIT